MKNILTICLFFILLNAKGAGSDSTKTTKDSTLCVGFGQDSFFGPYTTVMGTYGITSKTQFVYYANYWSNFAFANMTNGVDFWTETGIGAEFTLCKDKLIFIPTVGVTYGKVLSNGEKGVIADGITPGFYTWASLSSKVEFTQGAYYFRALRETGAFQNNFIWWWAATGYKITPTITAGVHYDQLTYHSNNYEMSNLYVWFGPYIQYNTPQGHSLKVTSGYDAINGEYFKANLSIVIF